eukprot:scaffold7226_cov27-Tisochrysis_lutea.AAC.2
MRASSSCIWRVSSVASKCLSRASTARRASRSATCSRCSCSARIVLARRASTSARSSAACLALSSSTRASSTALASCAARRRCCASKRWCARSEASRSFSCARLRSSFGDRAQVARGAKRGGRHVTSPSDGPRLHQRQSMPPLSDADRLRRNGRA